MVDVGANILRLNQCHNATFVLILGMRSLTSNSKTLFASPDYGDTFYPTYGQHYDNIMEAYRDNREKTRPVPVLKSESLLSSRFLPKNVCLDHKYIYFSETKMLSRVLCFMIYVYISFLDMFY